MELIDKAAVVAEIDKLINSLQKSCNPNPLGSMQECLTAAEIEALSAAKDAIKDIKVKNVDLEKESELIANGIMISVQSNKYGTNIYNTERNDFNHYHLQMAARKGIELGLKVTKEK